MDSLKLHRTPPAGNDYRDTSTRIADALERIAAAMEREEKRNAARAMSDSTRPVPAIRALP